MAHGSLYKRLSPGYRLLWILCWGYVALFIWLPLIMVPFVHVLPYMHERPLVARLQTALLGTILVCLAFVFMARAAGRPLRLPSSRVDRCVLVAALVMAVYVAGAIPGNALAALVWLFPGESVVVEMRVAHIRPGVLGYRTQDLVLQDEDAQASRYVTVARLWFAEVPYQQGDRLQLQVRHNALGMVVQRVTVTDRPPSAHPLRPVEHAR
ncbi:hypothetical protein [Azohydromonas aeria]|uniref:hypothetical protein n=1 Tax=Azohydromonas aeria TaxID=2590212 RepID=UPI0012F86B95|nr:hypothetical protein [Azohydromonas aeria]